MTETAGADARLVTVARRKSSTRMTRPVLRAEARVSRRGRKGAKAARRVALFDLAGARETLQLVARSLRARQAKAGQMPHVPRATPRERLRPHLGKRS